MNTSRYDFFDKGIFIDPMIDIGNLKNLSAKLMPHKIKKDLIRLGGNSDGGYLLPNDLAGIKSCFSPGVDVTATFESDLFERGIGSHLIDYSVDKVPNDLNVLSFEKKFLGAVSKDKYLSLEDWVNKYEPDAKESSLILQMDIEGAEYETLLACPSYILSKFRIVVIEFHLIETWAQKDFFKIVESCFDKLFQTYSVVHNHPNNAMGLVNLNGFSYPRLIEVTFYKNDLVESLGLAELPHALDYPNVDYLPVLNFPNH